MNRSWWPVRAHWVLTGATGGLPLRGRSHRPHTADTGAVPGPES
ncbi:hypothetical protein J2X01_001804 [Arthrobacter ginsengisoli]|uniref:Uncharacterized protein n=1 Tax=Arthrobacter ginsengisoli TaxID=1356565 RepID=A0ABU1UBM1_9MICC|nr:hypothetical protein [Arthrobacter ginsengisoli]MDR7082515.1 hypothetical protein [Arthrobacter ginsengisoli]